MADISYTPTTWADGSGGGTPIDSTKLNNIEQGIVDAVAAIGPNDTTEDGTLKAQIDALGDSVAKKASFLGIATNSYLYTYVSSNSNHYMQVYTEWSEGNGMFLQFGEDGGIDLYKIVNNSLSLLRHI